MLHQAIKDTGSTLLSNCQIPIIDLAHSGNYIIF